MQIQQIHDWKDSFPLFTGEFQDLDPNWYSEVGTTIIFCMILNVFTPHAIALLEYLYIATKRCLDSCCAKNKITKLKNRREYESLYLGPEFEIGARYSQILTTIFIILIYSSGMPILYVCTFICFFLTYWIDKFLILRFYRTPPHIDLYISRFFSILILLGIIIHYCFGIWMYGNKSILVDNSKTSLNLNSLTDQVKNIFKKSKDSMVADIADRVTYPHNVILFIFLLFLALVFVWRILFMDFLTKFCCRCFKIQKNKIKTQRIYDCNISIKISITFACSL